MWGDYERARAWREHKKFVDMEYERRKRGVLRVVQPSEDYEPNDFRGETTALTRPAPIVRGRADGDGIQTRPGSIHCPIIFTYRTMHAFWGT